MKKYLFYIIISAVSSECAVKHSDVQGGDNTFSSFFREFARDSIFQSSRIDYPLEYFFYSDDSDNLISRKISKGEWRFVNFEDDSLAKNRVFDAFKTNILEKDSSNVEYEVIGIDNGISISYSFNKKDDKWFLIKVVNGSN